MHRLTYRITTLSPLVLATRGGKSHFVNTWEYIRGTVMLGMFAGKYIATHHLKRNAHENVVFRDWFLHGSLSFGNAYIDSLNDRNEIIENTPVPLSIRVDKSDKINAFDSLLQEVPVRNAPLDGFGRIEAPILYRQQVKKSLNYHHQHNPTTGTVERGIFFNYEAIEQGQTFTGSITGDEATLKAFREEFSQEDIFYMGRSRNTQYGKIKLEFLQGPTHCNHRIGLMEGGVLLTLLSPLIIYNRSGFSTTDTTEFQRVLNGNRNGQIKIEKAFVKTREVENFISVWRLKRPSEVCFKEGSAFLLTGFTADDGLALQQFVEKGIGERRKEGFGRVALKYVDDAEPVELTVRESLAGSATEVTAVPDLTHDILEKIVKKVFFQSIRKDAIEKSSGFKELQSKSLLSRLIAIMNRKGKSVSDFKKTLEEDLRKTARDHLERCNNGKVTLYDFIQDQSVTAASFLERTAPYFREVNRLLSDSHIKNDFKSKLLADKDFNEALYKLYFETFFTAMRKRIQAGQEA